MRKTKRASKTASNVSKKASNGGRSKGANGDGARRGEGGRTTSASTRPTSGRRAAEGEIRETFGFVPDFYGPLPDAMMHHAWGIQRDLEMPETALDARTKQLIGLAIASHIKCRYCIYYHTEAAQLHGATAEQLREAIAMGGFTALMSNSISGAQIDFDRFQREVDRALDHVREQQQAPPARAMRT